MPMTCFGLIMTWVFRWIRGEQSGVGERCSLARQRPFVRKSEPDT
jgi:hypothetical protein